MAIEHTNIRREANALTLVPYLNKPIRRYCRAFHYSPFSPSGNICGVYARTDTERGTHKSPANEVIRLTIGFEKKLNKGKQELLNPKGINSLRKFRGRGYRVWGARTISSDPEWRYINVRRYFVYLERSIDVGTHWAVFENNGEALWSSVRESVENFSVQ